MSISKRLFAIFVFLSALPAHSYKEGAFSAGLGYYSQNVLNRLSKSESGTTGFLGETSYPLHARYDLRLTGDWYWAPQLSTTLLYPRSTPGNTSKVTLNHLMLQFGKNGSGGWEWFVGPGLLETSIKGAGGTVVMNNGTSTATFAVPGRTASIKQFTTNAGFGYGWDRSRLGFELTIENLMSSPKRAQSLMLAYAYQFGGY